MRASHDGVRPAAFEKSTANDRDITAGFPYIGKIFEVDAAIHLNREMQFVSFANFVKLRYFSKDGRQKALLGPGFTAIQALSTSSQFRKEIRACGIDGYTEFDASAWINCIT